jgi:type IV pilus assembly protein PilW
MLALSLGLLVVASILQIFISSNQSYRLQEQTSRLQESERFALESLSKAIRFAGYQNDPIECLTDDSKKGNPIKCRKRAFPASENFEAGQVVAAQEGDLMVRYQGSNDNSVTDCFGDILCGPEEITLRFSLTTDNNGLESLSCSFQRRLQNGKSSADCGSCKRTTCGQPANPPSNPLVSNIENMQVFYGVNLDVAARDNVDQTADAYFEAQQMNADNWVNVVTVRVALLLASDRGAGRITSVPQAYRWPPFPASKAKDVVPDDYRLRRVSTATVSLSNVIP